MRIKNEKELDVLREGGKMLADILRATAKLCVPGKKTIELDEYAERMILDAGGRPSFKGYGSERTGSGKRAYPASLCVSINDEIVHGIPSERVLKDGDIVGLDLGMEWRGLYTDTAITVAVGDADDNGRKLIEVARASLQRGIAAIHDGARVGDIGYTIQSFVEDEGFEVIRELVGHGVGRAVHEDPEIPNWGSPNTGVELKEGMVLALEPMVAEGSHRIKLANDGWTWKTADGKRAAHFEHTIIVSKNGAEIITK